MNKNQKTVKIEDYDLAVHIYLLVHGDKEKLAEVMEIIETL